MIWLRSVVYYPLLAISVLLFGLLIVLLGWMLPERLTDRLANDWGCVNLWLQWRICGLGYDIEGLEHLTAVGGPAIIMAKHQSAWETIALRGLLPTAQSWVLKKELLYLPVFGWALKIGKAIPIDRSAGRRAVLQVVEQGIRRLNEGRYVIIFPEGTRTAPGERRKYGLGGGVLAERSGFPVIPIAHNAGVFWRRRGVKKYPGRVQVRVGPLISSEGRKAAEIMRDVENWIEAEQLTLPQQIF